MKDSIIVKDDFCPQIDEIRQSALESGFGKWTPNQGLVGTSVYDGMNFAGNHDLITRGIHAAIGRPVYPRASFFRITTPETRTYIHSDRTHGNWTCIVYLSNHKEISGTAFYRHRETGLLEMPSFEEQRKLGLFDMLKKDMESGGEDRWEKLDFIRGVFNRALIFNAPLFHARVSEIESKEDSTARMVHVTHFYV